MHFLYILANKDVMCPSVCGKCKISRSTWIWIW